MNPPLEKQSMDVRSVVGTYIHNIRVVKMKKCQEPMVFFCWQVFSTSWLQKRKEINKKLYKNSLF